MPLTGLLHKVAVLAVFLIPLTGCQSITYSTESFNVKSFEQDIQNKIKSNVEKMQPLGGVVKMAYHTREDVKQPHFTKHQSQTREIKNLGALTFTKVGDKNSDVEEKVFLLQRAGGAYLTETKIHQSYNHSYFLSVGVDYKEKIPMMGFRVEF